MKLNKHTRFVVRINTYIKHDDKDTSELIKSEEKEVSGNECLFDISPRYLSNDVKTYKTITPLAVRLYKESSLSKAMIELDCEYKINRP